MPCRLFRFAPIVALVTALLLLAAPALGHDSEVAHGARAAGDPFGDAVDYGSMRGRTLAQPVVGMASTRSGRGYWLVARDGGIFSFGDAAFYGSTGNIRLNQPIVGMTRTPGGTGYWFVAADGGVFSFGDAAFYGSTGNIRLNQPIVGMAATPTGNGYWLVARDGGMFAFGDAGFFGSAGGTNLGQSVVGMASSPSGHGYWLTVADGRVLPYGDARSVAPSATAAGPFVGMAATPGGNGYWTASRGGAVSAFGDARHFGPADAGSPVVGIASTPSGSGYWLVTSDGDVLTRAGNGTVGTYAFLARDSQGRPLRYDPCRPVRFAINPDGAPVSAVDEVREAFRRIGEATGIQFADAGATNETHMRIGSGTRPAYQPERYGKDWAPILVSWTTEQQEPVLAGNVLGYGGSTSYWTSGSDPAYITGEVIFDRDLSILRGGFGPGLTRGNLFQHELGHVVGLDHVQDRGQLLYPSLSQGGPDGFGGGDRAGLAQLGAAAGCLHPATPPSSSASSTSSQKSLLPL